MNKMVDLRTIHYFDPKTWTMRGNWSSGRYITWTRKTTRPFEMWPEAWDSEKIGLAQKQIAIADWKKTKARRDEYEKKDRGRKVMGDTGKNGRKSQSTTHPRFTGSARAGAGG